MLHIVALSSTKVVVEVIQGRELTPGLMSALANNYAGGDIGLLSFYTVSALEESRVLNGDEYGLVWEGSSIVGLDFSVEDSKPFVGVAISRSTIKADAPADLALSGIDVWSAGTYHQGDYAYRLNAIYSCTASSTTQTPTAGATEWKRVCSAALLTLTAYLPDGVTVSSFSSMVTVPVIDNQGRSIPLLCSFVSGECEVVLAYKSISECGSWYFPSSSNEIEAVDIVSEVVTKINVLAQQRVNIILPF